MMSKSNFIAQKAGRLDEILCEELDTSRSQAQKYIEQGVLIDGIRATKNGAKVKIGQELTYESLNIPTCVAPDLERIPFDIVYEDEYLMVINKPRGLVVHPSPGHFNDTLVNYLVHNYAAIAKMSSDGKEQRPGIVHRIDKDTSGLLIIAKTTKAFALLQAMISKHQVKRDYLCLVQGVPAHKRFKIDAPIARSVTNSQLMCVDTDTGRPSVTRFVVISSTNKVSLLSCKLETGRTHQIRVHLAHFHYPIIGDSRYGTSFALEDFDKGQVLHAYKLSFVHPVTLENLTFYAPLDEYFKSAIRYFYQ